MFCFILTSFSILIVLLANPVRIDPTKLDDVFSMDPDISDNSHEITSNGISIIPGLDIKAQRNPSIVTIPLIIEDSNLAIDPVEHECYPFSSSDSIIDGNFQKRGSICPMTDGPKKNGQTRTASPSSTSESQRSTTPPRNPCPPVIPLYLTCGGTEYLDPSVRSVIAVVFNCVYGKFSNILI